MNKPKESAVSLNGKSSLEVPRFIDQLPEPVIKGTIQYDEKNSAHFAEQDAKNDTKQDDKVDVTAQDDESTGEDK